MSFQARNTYYLRISEQFVLPLHLYLDERHLDWMSDTTLQHVLADMRPHILAKLQMEANLFEGGASSKKATLDTHRGETYQFCYFFRKAEPHSVVIKSRNFVTASSQRQSKVVSSAPSSSQPQRSKRKSKFKGVIGANEVTRKKRKTRRREQDSDEGGISTSSGDESLLPPNQFAPRRSRRSTKTPTSFSQEAGTRADLDEVGDSEVQITTAVITDRRTDQVESMTASHSSNNTGSNVQEEPLQPMEIELEEEEKPKPLLQLKYQGFNILGSCLCVVVEPWPPLQPTSRVPLTREPTVTGTTPLPRHHVREETPLFLPDDNVETIEALTTSRGWNSNPALSLLDPSLLEDSDESGSENGMILFSQVLNNTGGIRAGAAEDNEDMDTDMFFGDADEIRELR